MRFRPTSARIAANFGRTRISTVQSGARPAGMRRIARMLGFVTSSAYGHHVKQSLALAYVDKEFVNSDLTVDVIGEARKAVLLKKPAYDPKGERMRL
jgi:glycine cleavage system aminomethyltransferase T